MILKFRALYIFLLVFWLAACVPVRDNTLEPSTDESAVVPTAQTSVDQEYFPLDTRTGLDEIDRILAVVESDDLQRLRDLLGFTTTACTTADGLGGPPKCLPGEAESTLVDVLPFLGGEGSFIRKADVQDWPGIDVSHLYAVYRVSESAYSEEFYPAGEYAIMFVGRDNVPGIVLQVREGKIIRIDYTFDVSSRAAILQRDASELILTPSSQK
jgi:hypothetical protein